MRFAYADPPYLGCGALYKGQHAQAKDADSPEWHRALVSRLCAEYDGWALSLHTPSLATILPMCPNNVRVLAWTKPFASFKPGVGLAYAWEPVIVYNARKRRRDQATVRDWLAESITLRKGLTGAKPLRFCWWILNALNATADEDTVDDIFPGTGIFGEAWFRYANFGHGHDEIGGVKR